MCVNDDEYTPLHYAAMYGHLSVVRMLVLRLHSETASITAFCLACRNGYEEFAITLIANSVCLSPLSTDSDGNTLLHIAVMYEQVQCVNVLLYTYNAPIYLRNSSGKTAIEMTKSGSNIIRTVFNNYLKQYQGNIQASYRYLKALASKKCHGEQRFTSPKVFVVGNSFSGKSTLIESLKREGFFISFSQVSENIVPLHTSGIVPSIHHSKTIGRVLYYDFAGDQEYYSSHSAILSNIMQSKVGANVFLVVINISKDINKIQEELGYWLKFVSYHTLSSRSTNTVVIGCSHVDLITNTETNEKLKDISEFMETHFSKLSLCIHSNILTLNCRQPRTTQCVRDAIFQISKDTTPYSLSLQAAILIGLLEKDFKNVVTCKVQSLLDHIKETGICLPTVAEYVYPILEQLHDIGLLMIIRRHDNPKDNVLLLNVSKLTSEVHKLLFSKSAVEKATCIGASMGILPQSYLNKILPEYIMVECLIQLQYCQSFNHVEVKADYVAPSESQDSKLFYFPALCTAEKKECIKTPNDFNYYIGCYIECNGKFDYFPPHLLHILLLRLAYSYALQAHENASTDSEPDLAIVQHYNRRCTMWKNGIHWLMEEGVECFVEMVNNSKGIVVVTKSKEAQNSTCIEMLYKIIREVQEAKEEFCDSVQCTLQHFLLNSDDPTSFTDKDKLFDMSEVERVLREGNPSIISINGRGHLDSAKVKHFMKCTLWSKLNLYRISLVFYKSLM